MKDSLSILLYSSGKKEGEQLRSLLSKNGYSADITSAESTNEFETFIVQKSPELVIIDSNLAAENAQTILSLREKFSHPPFIISGTLNGQPYVSDLRKRGIETMEPKQIPTKVRHLLKQKSTNSLPQSFDISQQNQILHSFINSSLNEYFLIEPDSLRFIFANEAMLDNLGYTADTIKNLSLYDVAVHQQDDLISKMTEPLVNQERDTITFHLDLKRADQSYYPAKLYLRNSVVGNRTIITGECSDLSHRQRQEHLLEEQKKVTRELRLSNKYKSDFFANLSHEMRTTLNTVQLLSQILAENRGENLNAEQLEYSESIHSATNSLLALLNEVLDMSKIESGKMNVSLEYVDPVYFCRELERLFQPVARERGVTFEFINELENEVPFKTDLLRLEQMLKNLISNALKFTDEGFVRLRMYSPDPTGENLASPQKQKTDIIAFEVQDTGVGISKNRQKIIFESYAQAKDSETTKTFGGTGLGLAITNEIAQFLGGSIELESEEGKGSTFTLYMPADSSRAIMHHAKKGNIKLSTNPTTASSAQAKKAKPKPKTPAERIPGTVLLVDDNTTHNMALKEFLGFKVERCITAQTAKEAYEMLETHQVECVILDMYLPDADGKEVVKKLKQEDTYPNLPVIIYSGKSLSQQEEEELETLADAIIQKNVMSYKILLSKITGILHKKHNPPKN